MYFITTINLIDKKIEDKTFKNFLETRCVGYFRDLTVAYKHVINNSLDIHEYLYKYVVIEKYDEGIYYTPEEIYWFEWDQSKRKYKEIIKPEIFDRTINFGIG